MLVVVKKYRKLGIGRKLVELFVEAVKNQDGDEVVLETEAVNKAAIALYESKKNISLLKNGFSILFYFLLDLGFARDKRLMNYYMSGNDAFRFKLWLKKMPVTN